MSDNKTTNIDLDFLTQEEDGEETDEEGEQSQSLLNPAAPKQGETSTVTLDGEEFELVPSEQHEECTECAKLKQRIEELEEENEKYQELVQTYQESRQSELQETIQSLNEDIPQDKQYSEEELEEKFQDSSIPQLEDMVDVMQRLVPEVKQSGVQSDEEDLTGTSGGNTDENEKQKEQINQAARDLFGKDLDDVLDKKEEKHN